MSTSHRGRPSPARALLVGLLHLLMVGVLVGVGALVAGAAPSTADSPGSADRSPDWRLAAAGTPTDGTAVFTEDFSRQDASSGAVSLLDYVGAGGLTYSADLPYTPAGQQCDGWLLRSTTPQVTADQDRNCGRQEAWPALQAMARDLGLAQGQSPGQALTNQALGEFTNNENGLLPAGSMLRTDRVIPAADGHYYALSAYVAQAFCASAHAQLTFSILVNGKASPLSSGLDPCTAPGAAIYSSFPVVRLQSAALKAPSGEATLGLEIDNTQTSGQGNDIALDRPQILDVTPSLAKSFSPSTIPLGGSSTLTFTVTNTSELGAKNDWTFTDNLPSGMTLVDGALGGTCADSGGDPLVQTAVAGGTSIKVTGGDLAAGQVSCTITAPVTTSRAGTFTNGTGNVTTDLLPPTDATLTAEGPTQQASWTLDKRVAAGGVVDVNRNGVIDAGDTVAYEFSVSNTGDVAVRNPRITDPKLTRAGITISCPVKTLAPAAATVCTTSAPYVITQADVDAGGVTNSATAIATPPAGVDPPTGPATDDVLTPTDRVAAWSLVKRVVAGGITDVNRNGVTDAGDTIVYEFLVSNTGSVTVRNPRITDRKLTRAGVTITCADKTLAPGAATVCTTSGPYTVTAADVAAGGVTNTATAVGVPPAGVTPPGSVTDTVTTPTGSSGGDPAWTLDKRIASGGLVDVNGNGRTDAGDTIAYEFQVTNTGDVSLSGLQIRDPKLAASGIRITCTTTDLPVGASVVCTASKPYVVTQADVDAGGVKNTATATAAAPRGFTGTARLTDTALTPRG